MKTNRLPEDMHVVQVVIEKDYTKLIDELAARDRVSRSRAMRNLIIEALKAQHPLRDLSVARTEQPTEIAA